MTTSAPALMACATLAAASPADAADRPPTWACWTRSCFAVGPALIGAYIAAAGYVPTTGGKLIDQPASAITALYFPLGVIAPAFLIAGGRW